MAERRMFAKSIITSDAFLDMPASTRCLYFTLSMLADDDGFVNNPRSIMRQCGSGDDDMRILVGKKFVLIFDDGVLVIKHWRIHNYIRSDRYVPTNYQDHLGELVLDEKNAYHKKEDELATVGIPDGIPSGIPLVDVGKDSIGKDSLGKDSKERKRFTPPTIEEVRAFIQANDLLMVAEEFHDYYESKGWKVGNAPMKSWEAACRNWARREKKTPAKPATSQNFTNPHTDDELDEFFRRSLERAKL